MPVIADSSVYASRAPNLGSLADSYVEGVQAYNANQNSRQARDLNAKEETRKQAEEGRTATQFTGEELARKEKRDNDRHIHVNKMLGDEAAYLSQFPPEKQKEVYDLHTKQGLHDSGIDVKDIPEFSPELIKAWRKQSMDDDQRLRDENDLLIQAAKLDAMSKGLGAKPVARPIAAAAGRVVGVKKTDVPQVVKEVTKLNEANKLMIDKILNGVQDGGKEHTGIVPGLLQALPFKTGDWVNDKRDPEGTEIRTLIGNLSSVKMKDLSGAVIPYKEMTRLGWIPSVEDGTDVIIKKLTTFKEAIEEMNQLAADQYNTERYFTDPLLAKYTRKGQQPVAPPQPSAPIPIVPPAQPAQQDSLDLGNIPRAPIKSDTTMARPPDGWKAGDTHRNVQGKLMTFNGTGWEPAK